ncbi:MAG TPA: hypothetical protein VFQ27_05725 [Xanthobacteraceae bacterium]|nr:hypothetical protein [Xanthobacteraceae bacterium]
MMRIAVGLLLTAALQVAVMPALAAATAIDAPMADELVNRPSPSALCIAPPVGCDGRA